MKNRGFSLVELIIVIAILAILAAAVTPVAIHFLEKGKISRQETNVKNIYTDVQAELVGYFGKSHDDSYFGAEEGKTVFVDSTTGKDCGRITSMTFSKIKAGQPVGADQREIDIANSIYKGVGTSLNYDSINPSGKNINTLPKGKVNIMIVYDEDGIVRIEYASSGFYTIYDGRNMETVKQSDDNDNLSFSRVE